MAITERDRIRESTQRNVAPADSGLAAVAMAAVPAPRILSSYASSVAKRLTVAPMILEDLFSWKVCTFIACFSSKIFYGMRLMGELLTFAQLGESPVKEPAVSVNHAVTVPQGDCVFLYHSEHIPECRLCAAGAFPECPLASALIGGSRSRTAGSASCSAGHCGSGRIAAWDAAVLAPAAMIEFFKRSCAGFPDDAPICVEYVAGQPEIAPELDTIYAAYLALPPHLQPIAVPWDLDSGRPADPVHAGPYTNPDQLRYLEQLHAHLGLRPYRRRCACCFPASGRTLSRKCSSSGRQWGYVADVGASWPGLPGADAEAVMRSRPDAACMNIVTTASKRFSRSCSSSRSADLLRAPTAVKAASASLITSGSPKTSCTRNRAASALAPRRSHSIRVAR
jgi:hypothetical protein